MRLRTAVVAGMLSLATACNGGDGTEADRQAGGAPDPAPAATAPSAGPPGSAPAAAAPPDAAVADGYGGQDVRWPVVRRTDPPPPALGAVRARERLRTSAGRTLPAGILLPRVGGSAGSPQVLTPCGAKVTVTGAYDVVPPRGSEPVIVIDPGHGGSADGVVGPDQAREADRNLDVAQRTAALLGGRVLLTRASDHDASLPFRVALADSLRADLSVSVHLNAAPLAELDRPGTSEFASVADPQGRRAAGVMYEAHRRYLETLSSRVGGRWAGNPDAGALYRLGSRGTDYYGLLRRASTAWVISEPLFLSDPEEAALVADPLVRQGLAAAYVSGIRAFLAGAEGSGWREPAPRPADPPPPPGQDGCVDPT